MIMALLHYHCVKYILVDENIYVKIVYISHWYDFCLKEYSMILIKSFYDINQQILRKKRLFPKFSVDSDFPFASYAWLCTLALLNRLLC